MSFGVHPCSVLQRALGKCNSVGQLIDVCQIDIDARGDKPFCPWHWNINVVNGTSTSHRRRRAEAYAYSGQAGRSDNS